MLSSTRFNSQSFKICLVACLAALVLALSIQANAADCNAIKKNVKNERSLLKRKSLLAEGIKICPNDPVINFMYGYSLERLRKYEEALRYYIIASALDKNYAKAFCGIGDIHMDLGNFDSAVVAYQKGLALDGKNKRTINSMELARTKLKAQSGSKVSSRDSVKVIKDSRLQVTGAGSVEATILRMWILFSNESAELSEAAEDQLSLVVGRSLLSPALEGARFEVAGHTDARGSSKANIEISRRRAQTVKDYLVDNFNIDPERLQVVSYGDTRPVMPNNSLENRRMNRRVEFRRLK